jgi:hypothetical protein
MASIDQPQADIMNLLKAIQLNGATLFQYVAVFNDQFKKQDDGEQEAIPLPAALLEAVEPIDWNALGGNLQQADIIWRVHIGMEQLDAGDGSMGQNLTIFQLRRRVIQSLSLKVVTASTPLVLVGDRPSYEHTNKYVYMVDFKSGFIDSSGSPYDPDAGVFIESTPPTALEVDTTVAHYPLTVEPDFSEETQDNFNADEAIEEDTITPQQKGEYEI